MGSLLPYFHGAMKLPTSALCLIPPPIPPVETFPKRQEQVISQAGGVFFVSRAPFSPGRLIGAGCGFVPQLLATHSVREQWKSFARGSLYTACSRKGRGDTEPEVSPLKSCPRWAQGQRSSCFAQAPCISASPHPLQRETPLWFPLLMLCRSDARSDASLAQAAAALSPAGRRAATGEPAAGPGQAARHWVLPGFGADGRLQRTTETLLHPGFN